MCVPKGMGMCPGGGGGGCMWATLEVARKDRHMRVIMLVEGIVVSVFVLSELSWRDSRKETNSRRDR